MNGKSEYTFENFIQLHQNQLIHSLIPQLYWETLFKKLSREVFDAGDVFMVQCVEGEGEDTDGGGDRDPGPAHSWRVVVSAEEGIQCRDADHIYLIDHAWTYRLHEARAYLENVQGLAERMAALMEVPTEGCSQKQVQDAIMKVMWKFNQVYSIKNFAQGTNEALPLWYVMDEFGSRIQHSDEPSFRAAPILFGPTGTAFTVLWPVRDTEEGDEVTRDFVHGQTEPEQRRAMLLPWKHQDYTKEPYLVDEPDESFFTAHRIVETGYSKLHVDPGKLKNSKLKVCIDYPDAPDLTDDRFTMVDTGEEADIIFTNKSMKDFGSLETEQGCKILNQFPCEACITVKDLLAVTSRRAASCNVDPDTLEGNPRWLPVTYNLDTELPQFISYFQHRQAKGLDNVWILKPWNLSNSADTVISDNLDQIIRAKDSGPKVACKYVSEVVTLHREDLGADVKIDLRFLVFLASVDPLRLYVYRPVSIRRGHKEYALTDFDDLRRHLTYVDLYKYGTYRPGMYTEEFVPKFEKEYPGVSWSSVECKMHQMILELFEAASSRPPPTGIAHCPASRAIYGIDIVLSKHTNQQGELEIQPMLCEVNFSPLLMTWRDNYPEMFNDAFSALFFDDIAGRENRVVRVSPR